MGARGPARGWASTVSLLWREPTEALWRRSRDAPISPLEVGAAKELAQVRLKVTWLHGTVCSRVQGLGFRQKPVGCRCSAEGRSSPQMEGAGLGSVTGLGGSGSTHGDWLRQ